MSLFLPKIHLSLVKSKTILNSNFPRFSKLKNNNSMLSLILCYYDKSQQRHFQVFPCEINGRFKWTASQLTYHQKSRSGFSKSGISTEEIHKYTFFKHSVFFFCGVSLSMLMIFLIPDSYYYAYSMLRIIDQRANPHSNSSENSEATIQWCSLKYNIR